MKNNNLKKYEWIESINNKKIRAYQIFDISYLVFKMGVFIFGGVLLVIMVIWLLSILGTDEQMCKEMYSSLASMTEKDIKNYTSVLLGMKRVIEMFLFLTAISWIIQQCCSVTRWLIRRKMNDAEKRELGISVIETRCLDKATSETLNKPLKEIVKKTN